jgi:hypothetical protein
MRALPVILSIALIASAAQAATAPKAGSACKKAGQTITASGKKFTCVKSGKKLVWNKGVATAAPKPTPVATATPEPTPSATPTPTTTKTPEPKPLVAGDPCNSVGEAINNSQGYLECRDVANNQKKYFQLSNSIADLPAQTSPLPFTTCRVPDQRTSKISQEAIAYPITSSQLKRTGEIKVLFIPFDFSDFPGSGNPTVNYSKDMTKFKEWVKWYSNGKRSVQIETSEKWIRASKPSTAYAEYMGHANDKNWMGFEMLLRDSERDFDYTGIDAVFLLFPPGLQTFATESTRTTRLTTNKGQMTIGIYATGLSIINSRTELWFWLMHELLHGWGIAQHGPGYPVNLNVSTGSRADGHSIVTWDAMILDWSNPDELWCTDLKNLSTSEVTLVPMEREQKGVRAAMINLAPSRTLIIESHRRDKWGTFNPGTYGLTAYIVDTRFNTDRTGEFAGVDDGKGINYTRAANFIEFPVNHGQYKMEWFDNKTGASYGLVSRFSLNYFLYEGESFTFEGVTVKLVKSGDNDTIQISKG